jgi:hypothetical protein
MIAHVQNGMSLLVNIGMVMAKQGAIRKRKWGRANDKLADNPYTHHLDLFTSTDLYLHGFCQDFYCHFYKTQLAQVTSHCHTWQ